MQSDGLSFKEVFDIAAFVAKKDGGRSKFFARLVETTMFATFVECQILGGNDERELKYFSELLKTDPPTLTSFVPSRVTRTYPPNTEGLDMSRILLISQWSCRNISVQPVSKTVGTVPDEAEADRVA